MKKLFSLFILCLCFSAAWGHDVKIDGIYYNLNKDDNTASVTYKGNYYYSYENEYTGEVVIPETINVNGTQYQVTSLGNDCFSGCSGLTSITIPDSVTSLGSFCFYKCSGLTSITIPNSVTSLGDACFYDCSGLTSITIPNSVTSLGEHCFAYCSGLTSIDIPNSVTSLGDYCFCQCSGLTSITIPSSVTSLGGGCFYQCSGLTSITIPNSVTSLGNSCFYGCTGLSSIIIPNSVTNVGGNCFSDAEYLIYCYQAIYDSLKEEYGERVVLYTSTAIGNVEAETAAPTVVGYYDLSGRRLSGQQRGLNIIRYSDGTSRKVMVK